MVPHARFNELLIDIEPSATTKANASAAHTGLREYLRDRFSKRWIDDFLAGSYHRDTAIRPRMTPDGHERPDVDIIVETNFTTSDHPDDVLEELRAALEDHDDGYEVERVNKRSVRVTAWNAEMDVVPVAKWQTGYQIPDRDTGAWRYTNPPLHSSWATNQNKLFDGRFVKLVKMFKWWRRENPTSGKRPKGFVLEMLVSMHAPKTEEHLGEAFAQLLEQIHSTYAAQAAIGYKPFIGDPALPQNSILDKVTVPQWKEFVEKARVYSAIAREAQGTDDIERATYLWKRVFGSRFRASSGVAKAAAASAFAQAAPAAASYSFPNADAAPKSPRGFA
jgi:hypothetical protein